MILRAPAKLNLCLYVGRRRRDGLHEICSLFVALTLADRLVVSEDGESGPDRVHCPEVREDNLAERALAALRERGWRRPPLRVEIQKRIPVAAGLGGGSADAAAILRLARGDVEGLEDLAASLGADVPSQLDPGPALVSGPGEIVEALPDPGEFAVVLVPVRPGLTSAEVYAEADRLGAGRDQLELGSIRERLRVTAGDGDSPLSYTELLHNDLEAAAVSLRPEIAPALDALRDAGAAVAMVAGSGPTAFGLFADLAAAERAAATLAAPYDGALVAGPERDADSA
jgi:4-diphosphocytidyl-2-C-methyl-D-erythritol kinase